MSNKIAKPRGCPLPIFCLEGAPLAVNTRSLVTRNGYGYEVSRETWKGFYALGFRVFAWRV